MTHRAGQIILATAQTLTSWSDLGVPSVFRDREFSLEESSGEVPCACVNEGDDTPVSEEGNDNVAYIDSLLEVEVVGYATGSTEPEVKAELRRQRREYHRALFAFFAAGTDPLGLPFVIAIKYGGAGKAAISTAGENVAGSMVNRFLVHYRMNFNDPGD